MDDAGARRHGSATLPHVQRPKVPAGLRRVWRDATTLQLGTSPQHGVVLTGLVDGDDAVIAALDGSHDLVALNAIALRRGLPVSRVPELLAALADAGALADASRHLDRAHLSRWGPHAVERLAGDAEAWSVAYAGEAATRPRPAAGSTDDPGAWPAQVDGLQVLAARSERCVVVDGAGRLGATVVAALSAAGVGQVRARDGDVVHPRDVGPAAHLLGDLGQPRAAAAERAAARAAGGPALPAPERPADLVVLVRDDVVDVREADELVRRDQPHLALVSGADRITVGPLVLPGRGPCLRCLDLHRTDRDPAWPHVAAQLLAHQRTAPPRAETGLVLVAAGVVTLQVLTQLDGQVDPTARGRTIDVLLPDGRLERRRWAAHSSCGCTRLPPETDPRRAGRSGEGWGRDPQWRGE